MASLATTIVTDSDYITTDYQVVLVDADSENITMTLCSAESQDGFTVWVKRVDSNDGHTVVVECSESQTMDQAATRDLDVGEGIFLLAYGGNWHILSVV